MPAAHYNHHAAQIPTSANRLPGRRLFRNQAGQAIINRAKGFTDLVLRADMSSLLALSPNFTVDIMLSVPRLEPGEVHRSTEVVRVPGGKGVNVARVVRQLGHQAAVGGFLGGYNGRFLSDSFAVEGLPGYYVWVGGETRETVLISEPGGRTTVVNEPGPLVSAEHVTALAQHIHENRERFDWVSLSGSVQPGAPPEAYAAVFDAARPAKLAIDTHGDVLALAIRHQPDLLRINHLEAAALVGYAVDSIDTARKACIDLVGWGNHRVVISLGEQGAVGHDGRESWRLYTPPISVISDVGAGDGMFAGILVGLMEGQSFVDALRRGVASAAACCTVQSPGLLPLNTFRELLDQVIVETLP
jgi:tagatose 6-phosphate kinase